ncbi:MAG: MOSC domain-containing protein [Anaerolineales bacterium]|nr:MOSC domain-containing protein [Anaerolineales bacterium]
MSMQGYIFQIGVSENGIPKIGRHSAEINELGLTEDRVGNPKKQTGQDFAVCLFSLDRILALQREGHPVFPGSLGENLDIVGLDWEKVQIGTRLEIGSDVLLEVTGYVKPCTSVRESFVDGNFVRILQKKHPGWSRVYARVLKPGKLKIGDRVSIQG